MKGGDNMDPCYRNNGDNLTACGRDANSGDVKVTEKISSKVHRECLLALREKTKADIDKALMAHQVVLAALQAKGD